MSRVLPGCRKTACGPSFKYKHKASSTFVCLSLLIGLISVSGAAELPLARVVLSSSGLAQFTHSGPITGGSTIDLTVRLDQVDDLLKSLVILDAQGAIGAVSLPGKAPIAELFRDMPFGPDALESRTALLNAFVGSEVEIGGQVAAKGRVFRVEPEEVALPNSGGKTTRHRLTLMTQTGLVQAILEEITALRFSDPQVQAQIERVLAGLTENRAKDRRRLSIGFLGEGTRRVAISYLVAAPVWKTAYRLVLPKDGNKARLQGWAVVENLTGGDWSDIDLVLVSGNPVALRQPLYTSFFSDRIEVPVSVGKRLLPRTDDADEEPAETRKEAPAPRTAAAFAAPAPAALPQLRRRAGRQLATEAAPEPDVLSEAAQAAEAEEASTQLLYRFPGKISLLTGHTMMVPFVDREISAARAWLYQPETSARHPLAAVHVRNEGDSGLPAGIVTSYENSADGTMNFVGDAQLTLVPKGASKFVIFALDTKTDIRREDKGVIPTTLGKAVNGVLTLTTRSKRTFTYEITAPSDEDRDIVVEESRIDGWKPGSDSKDVEETATRYRYKVTAPKGKTAKAALTLERVDSETVALTSLGAESMLARIRGLQNETPALKDAITKLAAVVAEINKTRTQRSQLETERKKIADDQERIRRNLQSVGQGTDLGRRYLDNLKTQEDRLAEITRTDQTLESELAAKQRSVEQLARQLTF
jgi:hypothetical protein